MRTQLGNDGLLSDDQRPVVSLSEMGRNYRLSNPRLLRILCYKVDGGMIMDNIERCDYALGIPQTNGLYFVELKGKDLRKAADQISETIRALNEKIRRYTFYGRIVLSRVQRPDLRSASVIALERVLARSGGNLKRGSRVLEEGIE